MKRPNAPFWPIAPLSFRTICPRQSWNAKRLHAHRRRLPMPEYDERTLRHIYLPGHGEREAFTSPMSGGGSDAVPARNRAQHAVALERALTRALVAADAQIAQRDANIAG